MTDGEGFNPTGLTSEGVDKDGNKYKTSVTNDTVIGMYLVTFLI